LEWFYVAAWGIGLMFVMALVPLNSSPKFTARFFTAMMSTWLLGGFVLAYMFSAAGPVFAHLVTADPSVQFTSLRLLLLSTLTPHGPIWETQLYLPTELHSHIAAKGGGISAMPSMHLATVAIYVIGAWRTRWLVPAILMWVTIFVSSGYFGYHYWIDGIAGAAIAALCWVSAGRLSSMVASSGVVPTRRRSREVAGAQPIPDVR
jgi:membrane-associated phospholipid phosphatase